MRIISGIAVPGSEVNTVLNKLNIPQKYMDPFTLLLVSLGGFSGLLLGHFGGNLLETFRGYNMTILGASGAGKTSLYRSLGMIVVQSTEPEGTRSPERTERGKCDILVGGNNKSNREVRFKATFDVPGNEKKYWKERVEKANLILYLIDAHDLLSSQDSKLNERIQEDLSDITRWMREESNNENRQEKSNNENRNPTKKLFIIGNHFDKIDKRYNENYYNYLEKFKRSLKGEKDYEPMATDIIIGSLAEVTGMQNIMAKVVSHL